MVVTSECGQGMPRDAYRHVAPILTCSILCSYGLHNILWFKDFAHIPKDLLNTRVAYHCMTVWLCSCTLWIPNRVHASTYWGRSQEGLHNLDWFSCEETYAIEKQLCRCKQLFQQKAFILSVGTFQTSQTFPNHGFRHKDRQFMAVWSALGCRWCSSSAVHSVRPVTDTCTPDVSSYLWKYGWENFYIHKPVILGYHPGAFDS